MRIAIEIEISNSSNYHFQKKIEFSLMASQEKGSPLGDLGVKEELRGFQLFQLDLVQFTLRVA